MCPEPWEKMAAAREAVKNASVRSVSLPSETFARLKEIGGSIAVGMQYVLNEWEELKKQPQAAPAPVQPAQIPTPSAAPTPTPPSLAPAAAIKPILMAPPPKIKVEAVVQRPPPEKLYDARWVAEEVMPKDLRPVEPPGGQELELVPPEWARYNPHTIDRNLHQQYTLPFWMLGNSEYWDTCYTPKTASNMAQIFNEMFGEPIETKQVPPMGKMLKNGDMVTWSGLVVEAQFLDAYWQKLYSFNGNFNPYEGIEYE